MDSNTTTVCDQFTRVLRDEIAQLRPQAHDPQQSAEACADRAQLMGLALSGGGTSSPATPGMRRPPRRPVDVGRIGNTRAAPSQQLSDFEHGIDGPAVPVVFQVGGVQAVS